MDDGQYGRGGLTGLTFDSMHRNQEFWWWRMQDAIGAYADWRATSSNHATGGSVSNQSSTSALVAAGLRPESLFGAQGLVL